MRASSANCHQRRGAGDLHEDQEVLGQLLDVVGAQLEVVEVLEIGQLVQCLDGVVLQPQLSGVGRYARRQ